MSKTLEKTYEYKFVFLGVNGWSDQVAENGAKGFRVVAATADCIIMERDRLQLKESSK